MILNLHADAKRPEELRDQINESLAVLATALNKSFIGTVVQYTGNGTYAHDLGVVPLFGLIAAETSASTFGIVTMPEDSEDWNDKTVFLRLDITGLAGAPGFVEVLLIGKP